MERRLDGTGTGTADVGDDVGDDMTVRAGAPRRGVLLGVGALGIGAALAGCGDGNGDDDGGTGNNGNASPGGSTSSTGGPGRTLGKVADVPVGGGKVFSAEKVVVTQPTAGEFKAFSAVCTHQGCLVNKVADGRIDCPCHGSQFSVTDGAVLRAAPGLSTSTQRPLPAKRVTVQGGDIVLT